MDEARAALDEAITTSDGGVSDFFHALSMTMLGMPLFAGGDLEGGIALVKRARLIQERLGDCEGGGVALSFLAQMTFAKGDHAGALATLPRGARDVRTGRRQAGDRAGALRRWAGRRSPPATSRAHGARSSCAVQAYEEVGSPRGTGLALMGLAAVEAAAGRPERAVTIAAAAQVLSERAGIVVDHPMDPGVVGRIEALKASIPKETLAEAVASGRTLSPAAVLAMVAE